MNVDTRALLRPLHAELVSVLRRLSADDWQAPTSAGAWRVRDVVAHLLDLDLRGVSIERDRHFPPPPAQPIESQAELVPYLAALNGAWTDAARRLSIPVLLRLVEGAGPEFADVMERVALDAGATFPVTWAGQTESPMWLHVAREYTERWHHQDQVREAVGAAPLDAPQWLQPLLAVSVLALAPAYAGTAASTGTAVVLTATGGAAASWSLVRGTTAWEVQSGRVADAACSVTAADLMLARLLLHRLGDEHVTGILVEGDVALAAPLLRARAVVV